ncbi:MAG: hypothetical protein E7124_09660 [Bacteroidales bacterium]|nr:hypothetical protein [Bacteroidales bacterium]
MKATIYAILIGALTCLAFSCKEPDNESQTKDFIEDVPTSITFTNAEFIYNGDDIGDATSDGWVIKMYTDMEIDETGAPVGPGCVFQMLLNVRYDETQGADASFLPGIYSEMINSGNFAPGTFVRGYMSSIDLPGGDRIDLADATYYADVAENSTEMDYDLIDEGAVSIKANDDGTYSIEGIMVGTKYTKRYFSWTGEVKCRSNVPERTPNSTLKTDITDPALSKGSLQDRGDYFRLMDESYRCLLLQLAGDNIGFDDYNKPTGDGPVLRLEILVSWDTDITNGIPEGSYAMAERNPDTSIDKEKIVPGVAIPGLPDEFALWKMAGAWYYEMKDGEWTGTYARIDSGTITVEREEDGTHKISYELSDCQSNPKRISGKVTLNQLKTF